MNGYRDALRVVRGERARGPRRERRVEGVGVGARETAEEQDGLASPAAKDLVDDWDGGDEGYGDELDMG